MVRVGRPPALLTIGVAAGMVVLVAVVATGPPVPLATEGTGGWRVTPRDDRRARPAAQDMSPSALPRDGRLPGEHVLAVLAQAVVIVVGVTAVLLIGRALWRVTRRRPEPLDLAPEEHWPAPAPAMLEAIDDGLAALAAGPVDEVVVACWVRLEEVAADAGVGRGAAETPAELAARLLGELSAPQEAVDVLLARYRRARYSHHVLGDEDRAVAVRALEQIRGAIAGAPA